MTDLSRMLIHIVTQKYSTQRDLSCRGAAKRESHSRNVSGKENSPNVQWMCNEFEAEVKFGKKKKRRSVSGLGVGLGCRAEVWAGLGMKMRVRVKVRATMRVGVRFQIRTKFRVRIE